MIFHQRNILFIKLNFTLEQFNWKFAAFSGFMLSLNSLNMQMRRGLISGRHGRARWAVHQLDGGLGAACLREGAKSVAMTIVRLPPHLHNTMFYQLIGRSFWYKKISTTFLCSWWNVIWVHANEWIGLYKIKFPEKCRNRQHETWTLFLSNYSNSIVFMLMVTPWIFVVDYWSDVWIVMNECINKTFHFMFNC